MKWSELRRAWKNRKILATRKQPESRNSGGTWQQKCVGLLEVWCSALWARLACYSCHVMRCFFWGRRQRACLEFQEEAFLWGRSSCDEAEEGVYLGQHCHPKLVQPVPFARDVELQACTTLPSDRKRMAEDGSFEEDVKDLERNVLWFLWYRLLRSSCAQTPGWRVKWWLWQ